MIGHLILLVIACYIVYHLCDIIVYNNFLSLLADLIRIACIILPFILGIIWYSDDNDTNLPEDKISKYIHTNDEEEENEEYISQPLVSSYYNDSDWNNSNNEASYENIPSRQPARYICQACRGNGTCRVCQGSGQTKTRRFYNATAGYYDLDWETCNTCGGSGRCFSCKGDGYIDEGIDF